MDINHSGLAKFVNEVVLYVLPSGKPRANISNYYVHVLITEPKNRPVVGGQTADAVFGLYLAEQVEGRGKKLDGPYKSHKKTVFVDEGRLNLSDALSEELSTCQKLLEQGLSPYGLEATIREVNSRIFIRGSSLVKEDSETKPLSPAEAKHFFADMRAAVDQA